MKTTAALLQAMLAAAKTELDGGNCHLYAGPVPESAGDALDMGADHTECAVLTLGGDGSTGLTFDAAAGGLLAKPSAAVWEGVVAFNGADDAESTLTPTFFRFVGTGDDPAVAGTDARLQGSVGGPSSAAEMKLEGATLTDNGTNTAAVATFNVRITPVG